MHSWLAWVIYAFALVLVHSTVEDVDNDAPWHKDLDLEELVRDALLGKKKTSSVCNVKLADPKTFRVNKLMQPMVFKGDTNRDQGYNTDWDALQWSREYLIEKYGDWDVMPALSHVLPLDKMAWRDCSDHQAKWGSSMPFRDFIRLNHSYSIFDRSNPNPSSGSKNTSSLVEEMLQTGEWGIPSFFNDLTASHSRSMAIGATGQGFPFHNHVTTWEMQVVGKKLWIFHGPQDMPRGWEVAEPRALLEKIFPKFPSAKQNIQFCLLEPGDMVAVPDWWWQATLNVGESIGIGGEIGMSLQSGWVQDQANTFRDRGQKMTVSAILRMVSTALVESEPKSSLSALSKAYKLLPTEAITIRMYIERLSMQGQKDKVAKLLQEFEPALSRLHDKGWLGASAFSALLSMVAFPTVIVGDQKYDLPVDQANALNKRAVQLDPKNWEAQISIAHCRFQRSDSLGSFEAIAAIPIASPGWIAVTRLLSQVCESSIGDSDPASYHGKFCKESEDNSQQSPQPGVRSIKEADPLYLYKGKPVGGPPPGYEREDVLIFKDKLKSLGISMTDFMKENKSKTATKDTKRKPKRDDKTKKEATSDVTDGDGTESGWQIFVTGLIGFSLIFVLWWMDLVDFPLLKRGWGFMHDKKGTDLHENGSIPEPSRAHAKQKGKR